MENKINVSRVLQERKHTILLVSLIFMSLVQPLAHGVLLGLVLYDVLLTCVLLGVFIVVFERTHERWLSVALVVPFVILRWASYGLSEPYYSFATATHQILLTAFFGLGVWVILRGIFEQQSIKSDHVIGTVCGYLLAGAAWGSCYSLCEQLSPHSFDVNPNIVWRLDDAHSRAFLFNYFSLCTLTGAGYGDITPIRPGVTSLTWLEAMFGQFYLAIVVAQLVGLKLAQSMLAGKQGGK